MKRYKTKYCHSMELHFSCGSRQNLVTLMDLLEAGADPNKKTEYGNTPLHWAAEAMNGTSAIVRALINAGADVNARNDFGQSPLHMAAFRGSIATAEELLNSGASVKSRCDDTFTPLHMAVINQSNLHLEMVALMLEQGADVNVLEYKFGQSPLHCAVECMHHRLVSLLLNRSADVNTRDNHGETPLITLAKKYLNDEHETLSMLVLDALLRAGVDVNAADLSGCTALHYAAGSGSAVLVSALLDAGADASVLDDKGKKPSSAGAFALRGSDALTRLLEAETGKEVNKPTFGSWLPWRNR